MSNLSSSIIHAMLLAVGAARHDKENGCIDAWNGWRNGVPVEAFNNPQNGYDNFYIELSKYAEKLAAYYNNIKLNYNKDPDELYDGCFSMEVSEKFGEWFALYVLQHGCAPNEPTATVAMQDIIDEYMSHPATIISLNPDKFPPKED